jgi:hypothetical protein
MSQQFYKKTPPLDPKIYLPGRTQETFPSGLLKVTRSYACLPSEAGSVQTVLGGGVSVLSVRDQLRAGNVLPDKGAQTSDAVGGPIIIFPDPTELKRDDGMIEFRATAYGRSTLNFNITQSDVQATYVRITTSDKPDSEDRTISLPSINRQYVVQGVVQTSAGLGAAISQPAGLLAIVRPGILARGGAIGTEFVTGYGQPLRPIETISNIESVIEDDKEALYQTSQEASIFIILKNLQSTLFGAYTEFSATWISSALIQTTTRRISSRPIGFDL